MTIGGFCIFILIFVILGGGILLNQQLERNAMNQLQQMRQELNSLQSQVSSCSSLSSLSPDLVGFKGETGPPGEDGSNSTLTAGANIFVDEFPTGYYEISTTQGLIVDSVTFTENGTSEVPLDVHKTTIVTGISWTSPAVFSSDIRCERVGPLVTLTFLQFIVTPTMNGPFIGGPIPVDYRPSTGAVVSKTNVRTTVSTPVAAVQPSKITIDSNGMVNIFLGTEGSFTTSNGNSGIVSNYAITYLVN